eukprot:scaffold59493_cov73-Phaeocystis_antarctica.AAC.8
MPSPSTSEGSGAAGSLAPSTTSGSVLRPQDTAVTTWLTPCSCDAHAPTSVRSPSTMLTLPSRRSLSCSGPKTSCALTGSRTTAVTSEMLGSSHSFCTSLRPVRPVPPTMSTCWPRVPCSLGVLACSPVALPVPHIVGMKN